MKNFVVDNSLKNLGKAVLWQYDRAVRLLSIMKHMQVLFFAAIEQFWAKWMERVLAIDSCGEFGCLVWSILLGMARPSVNGPDGRPHQIAPSVYRRLLKGKYYLSKASPSAESIQGYLEIVFGVTGREAYSEWVVTQCEYGWSTNVDELNPKDPERQQYHVRRAYDEGDVFHFQPTAEKEQGVSYNWEVKSPITSRENVSWEAISAKVEATDKEADLTNEDAMIMLKLYDPNGICRKIAGAPSDALSITAEYVIGDTTVTATVTRRRRSGVVVVDDGDMAMHYEKTEFFTEMHKDQQALFNQRMDDVCPYPLGIKTNEPVEEVVFGFKEQQAAMYEPSTAYDKGAIFSNYVNDGVALNWECVEPISAEENISFDAIKEKLKATTKGYPIVGNMVDYVAPYQCAAVVQWFSYTLWDELTVSLEITEDKWPAVAAIFPTDRFTTITYDSGTTIPVLDSGCVYLPYEYIFLGTYNHLTFAYKIPDLTEGQRKRHEDYVQNDITDGKTFVAKASTMGLQIITTKMPRMNRYYEFQTADNPFVDFGIQDALGYIAHVKKWNRYVIEDFLSPLSGVKYPDFAVFGKGVNSYYLDGTPVPNTTIISNSTFRRTRFNDSR